MFCAVGRVCISVCQIPCQSHFESNKTGVFKAHHTGEEV